MIISASRRTDIPAFYSEWLCNRIEEGHTFVRNPRNYHQVSKISLSPDVVDCIVFWTKNPTPMLDKIGILDGYPFYFQFTLTPYNGRIESNMVSKEAVVEAFIALSEKVGKRRIIWRYDPIFLSDNIDEDYHFRSFQSLCSKLKGRTEKCVISFIDFYKHIKKNLEALGIKPWTETSMRRIAQGMADIGRAHGLRIESCAEDIDLSDVGIGHGKCIDDKLISEIVGTDIMVEKDSTQRESCGCVASIDIGLYNTCDHHCLYCYANFSRKAVEKSIAEHDPRSPLLYGQVGLGDRISERKMSSCKAAQDCLFPVR